ncbi:MAG: hypothetical protein KDB61_10855 [Planctomycetes bacterium]|nr:hypothetical protein [Planctomycetota bacterium]
MTSSSLRKPDSDDTPPFRLLHGGKAGRHAKLSRSILVLLGLATVFRIWTAIGGSQGILAEETYGVLRQGRNLLASGEFAFNVGVQGSSAPLTLFGLLLAPVQSLFGSATPWFLLTLNAVLWTGAILTLLRPLRPSIRPGVALLLALAPAFVDGALRGTDAEWLGALLALSYASVSVGRTVQATVWFTLAVLSSPATCLFAPVLFSVHGGRLGLRFGLLRLMRPSHVAAALVPVGAWALLAARFSDQSVWSAWLQWAAELSSPWHSLGELWLGLPRYTLLAGTQNFPIAAQHGISVLMFALLAITIRENLRNGNATSRGWLCYYLLMVAFGSGVTGSVLEPAASILPAMAFTMALIPVLLPLVPRFHGTRLLRGSALVLATLAMPIGFSGATEMRTDAKDLRECVDTVERAQDGSKVDSITTGEPGQVGFLYSGPVFDISRLDSGDRTPWAVNSATEWMLTKDAALANESQWSPVETRGNWHLFRRTH